MHSFLLFRDNGLLRLHVVYSAQRLKELPKNRGGREDAMDSNNKAKEKITVKSESDVYAEN